MIKRRTISLSFTLTLLVCSCESKGQYIYEFNKEPIQLREFNASKAYKKNWADTLVIFFENGFENNVRVEVNDELIFEGFIETDGTVGLAKIVETLPLQNVQTVTVSIDNDYYQFSPITRSNYYYITMLKREYKVLVYHGDVVPIYE
jgi:hypothetical protein